MQDETSKLKFYPKYFSILLLFMAKLRRLCVILLRDFDIKFHANPFSGTSANSSFQPLIHVLPIGCSALFYVERTHELTCYVF
jgi:hypothetical protein